MIIIILLNACVDYVIFRILKSRCRCIWSRIYASISILITLFVIIVVSLPRRDGSDGQLLFIMWSLFSYFSIYLPKYTFLLSRMLCFKKKIVKYISPIGLLLGCICAILMWWGALINRYKVDIEEVAVEIKDLPASFDDYKIAQISDLHLGTFNGDTIFVSKLVNIINTLDVDLVAFTGDIVNRKSEELLPYESLLSRIKAKNGVLSVLGNHDYGDYLDWATPKDKEENLRLMYEINQRMGWDLLLNESKYLYRGNDSIVVIGVENIGDPPFKVYGSLGEANQSLADSTIKILLTHNPAHWEQDIKDNKKYNIALTLSGHTHAMQIELFGFSPSIFRYNYWKGLYKDSLNRYLYVNVGAGTVAMPMRIGATPEITVLTLKCAK